MQCKGICIIHQNKKTNKNVIPEVDEEGVDAEKESTLSSKFVLLTKSLNFHSNFVLLKVQFEISKRQKMFKRQRSFFTNKFLSKPFY